MHSVAIAVREPLLKRISVLLIAGLVAAGSAGSAAGRSTSHSPLGTSSRIATHRFSSADAPPRGSSRRAGLARPEQLAGGVAMAPPRDNVRTPRQGNDDDLTSGPIPYTSSPVQSDYKIFPLSTNGRLFATFSRGTTICSGTVISSGPSNPRGVVLTAARCVYKESMGGFPEQATFIPAYSGNSPFGQWPAKYAFVPTEWVEEENVRYDMATLYIEPKPDGETLEKDHTGGMGLRWNQPAEVYPADGFGYPDSGQLLHRCRSETHFGFEPQPPPPGDPTVAIGCNLPAEGTAGGGWVVNDPEADDSYLISLFSYKDATQSEVSFGPYFNSTTRDLYVAAATADIVRHKMKLSLYLSGSSIARGRIKARDDYRPCGNQAPIRIQRKSNGNWRVVKKASSNAAGRYKVKIPDRPGLYRAFSPAGSVNAYNDCSSATSPTRRH